MKRSKMKKCMDLNEMKKSLTVKTHIKAGGPDVIDPGKGAKRRIGKD